MDNKTWIVLPENAIFNKIVGVWAIALLLTSCQAGKPRNSLVTVTVTPQSVQNANPTDRPTQPRPIESQVGDSDNQGQFQPAEYPSGSTIELTFSGPDSQGLDPESNPYALVVDLVFAKPDGERMIVPAFYDGDGRGGIDGDVWKARLLPYQEGTWHYEVHNPDDELDGSAGSFEVVANRECSQNVANLYCKGPLQYTGGYYLQFQNGDFWIKAGLDDPENFLGKAFGDWEAKRSQIDLLSQMGVNSIYLMLNNVEGDRRDTWPWIGETEQQAKSYSDRYDVARLQAWDEFFSYAQQKGIVLHIVFNDDSAWSGYDQKQFIREMIARFGHHPGIIWNVGEEANEIFSDREQLDFAAWIREIDPYQHPVTVHRKSPWPFLGEPEFDTTSIQVGDGGADFTTTRLVDLNKLVAEHRDRSNQRGYPIPIMIDETPRITQVNVEVREKFRKQILYPIYLTGGNFELHFQDAYGGSGSVSIEDLEPLISDMVLLRELLEALPFPEMQPCNQLLKNPGNLCFGASGNSYLVYLPEGGNEQLDLSLSAGTFARYWFNPRNGEIQEDGLIQGGQLLSFTAPEQDDWVLLLDVR